MRILFLTNHLRGDDGWSRVSWDFVEELQNLGCEVLCLTSKSSGQNKIKELSLLEDPIKYLANPLISFSTALKIKKEVSRFSPEIIHFMAEPYATLLPFLSIKKSKTFLTAHGTYSVIPALLNSFFKRAIANYLSKKYYKKLTGITAVSRYTKNHLLRYYPELEKKVRVITNGVNLERNEIIDLPKKAENKVKKILFVGTAKDRKGLLESVEALRYYRDNISDDFVYDIVGDYNPEDKYYLSVLRKTREYNLGNKVFFRGRAIGKELAEFYFNADLFLMPSLNIENNFEGFGLVFLEANTKGVPCVGSKDSGSGEAIKDGKTGYIVDPFNFQEIAQKIDLVLNKNSINRKACQDWARQNDIKIKAKELYAVYNSSN